MARLGLDSSLDLSREIAALRSFHVQHARKTVGLIYGPKSREDKYYLDHCPKEQLAFTALMESFERLGLAVTHIDPTGLSFVESLMRCDLCFLNMHGEYGEDGSLQGLLDYLAKPYTGSGVLASAVGLNKVMFKYVLLGSGVSTPPFRYCSSTSSESMANVLDSLTGPIIAKPISGGSSIGMRLLADPTQVAHYLREATHLTHGPIFFERFMTGRALTVGVLELEYSVAVTPVIEVRCQSTFYDENVKLDAREEGLVQYDIPAVLDTSVESEVTRTALQVHQLLGCVGFSRIDFMLSSEDGQLYVLELNTIPGMSRDSNFVAGTKALGLSYDHTVLAMLRSCLWAKR